MVRSVASALVLLILAPALALLVFAAPASADTYGTATRVTWSNGWWSDVSSCYADAYYTAGDYVQVTIPQVGCSEGVSGFLIDEGGSTLSLSFTGVGDQGACSYETGSFPYSRGAASAVAASGVTGCKVTQACLSGHIALHGWPDEDLGQHCVAVDLGPLPQPAPDYTGSCTSFAPDGAPWFVPNGSDPTYGMLYVQIKRLSALASSGAAGSVAVTPVYGDGANGTPRVGPPIDLPVGSVPVGGTYSFQQNYMSSALEGVQFSLTTDRETTWNAYRNIYAGDDVQGFIGETKTSVCRVYLGKQIATVGDSFSVPAGPLGTGAPSGGSGAATPPAVAAPPGAGSSCTFSISDPTTWASGGICALVGLMGRAIGFLGALVNGVAGLPAAILNGLGDALSALFVPDQSHIDGLTNAASDALQGSSAGSWVNAFSGAIGSAATVDRPSGGLARVIAPDATAPASLTVPDQVNPDGIDPAGDSGQFVMPGVTVSGGCAGVGVNLPDFLSVDVGLSSTLYPVAACTGPAAQAAGIVRKAATALIAVLGLMKCIELLGNGLGFAKNIRLLDGYNWSTEGGRLR